MAQYRLFFLNEAGHILRAEEIEAADDEAAEREAILKDHAHVVEVWQLARRICVVDSKS